MILKEKLLNNLTLVSAMDGVLIAFILAMGLALMDVLGDFFIKEASLKTGYSGWILVLIGAVVYALTAWGVFFVFRKIKISTAGAVFSVTFVVFVTLLSVFYFKERINSLEIIAIFMAIASVMILYRFA